jgi:hypothetical protein
VARKIGSIPLGPPPRKKPQPAPPNAIAVTVSQGSPPSVFVQISDERAARGAIQGEPPDLMLWMVPNPDLLAGMQPSVVFQLPGGRFLEMKGLVKSQNKVRALMAFPKARPEDLHLLALARSG